MKNAQAHAGLDRAPARKSPRKALSRALAVVLSVLALSATLAAAPASAAAPAWADGRFEGSGGANASFTGSCLPSASAGRNAVVLNLENEGFKNIALYFLRNGQWITGGVVGVHDTTWPNLAYQWTLPFTGDVALYVFLQDRSGTWHGEWIPFISGSIYTRTGYWCGPRGAH